MEAETPEQAEEAVLAGADGVLLDEISPQILNHLIPKLREMAAARTKNGISNKIVLEASGVDLINLRKYAETGVDLISTSAPITKKHWVDFSMRFN